MIVKAYLDTENGTIEMELDPAAVERLQMLVVSGLALGGILASDICTVRQREAGLPATEAYEEARFLLDLIENGGPQA